MRSRVCGFLAAAGLTLGLSGCGLNGSTSLPGSAGPAESSSAARAGLPGGTWRLAALREANQPEVAIARPDLFTVEFAAGRPLYVGSRRNGVASNDYGEYSLSLRFR